jgi:hypothetical protein
MISRIAIMLPAICALSACVGPEGISRPIPIASPVMRASPEALVVRVATAANGEVATTAPVTVFDYLNLLSAPVATAFPFVQPPAGSPSNALVPCGYASLFTAGIGSWVYSVGANALGGCTIVFTDAAGNTTTVQVTGTN